MNKTEEDKLEIKRCKLQLDKITTQKLKGLFVRSRLDKELYDEKSTQFFFNRIRYRRTKADISAIKGADGLIYEDQTGISEQFTNYYRQLYSKAEDLDPVEREEFLSELPTVLNSNQQPILSLCSKDFLLKILKGTKNNKTPGPDGLPTEFYKTFFDLTAPILLEVFDEIVGKQALPQSMLESIVVLINKEGNPLDMSNKRPISLLNTDYKLFASVLKEKVFSNVLDSIISREQLCSVQGRSIQDGLCLMRDVIDYYRDSSSNVCAVSLDQRKAFDIVDREFLYACLARFGFDDQLVGIIKLLYTGTTAHIQINGHLTENIFLERGVRQGCPLSPILYIIYIDSLIRTFKSGLQGIPVCGSKVCISAYADDIILYCNKGEIEKLFSICASFQRATGSEVNINKTRILGFPGCTIPQAYSVSELKYLGVLFSFLPTKQVIANNCLALYRKIEAKVNHLSRLTVSLKGKAFVVNTLLAPVYFHFASVYLPNVAEVKKVRRLIFSFLWGAGKAEVLPRKILEMTTDRGGLGLVNFFERLQSLYAYANLCRPVVQQFSEDNPRLTLFRYNFSERVRLLYPHTFRLHEPHRFSLSTSYQQLYDLFQTLRNKLAPSAPYAPDTNQVYSWLMDQGEVLALVHPPGFANGEVAAHIYKIITYGNVATPVADFVWRCVRGALKTGEVVARFRIPEMRTQCLFCDSELESVSHLFLFCPFLKPVRDRLLSFIERAVGRSSPELDMLFLISGQSTARVDKTKQAALVNMVGQVNRVIWRYRNDVLFNGRQNLDLLCISLQVDTILLKFCNLFPVDNG